MRKETILSVFVASPSDVDEERNRLEEVVRELNVAWARNLGVRLELIRWETHAFPSFGESPQEVINEQIPQDYDLFIGLMWYKFGTPTGNAGSGTVDEFQRAKRRYDEDPGAVQLMIYFKDEPAPVPPSQLDPAQLASVAEFRASLGQEGGLYWPFHTTDDFARLVRLHLTRCVQAWRSRTDIVPPSPTSLALRENAVDNSSPDEEDDDMGLLDVVDHLEDEFATLKDICERIAYAIEEIGAKLEAGNTEVERINAGPEAGKRKAARRAINRTANDMDQYVHKLESEIPLFSQHLNGAMNAVTQVAALSIDFNTDDDHVEQIEENVRSIAEFRETMSTVEGQLAEFREAVSSLPRVATDLNRAKRGMVRVIQQLIDEFHSAQMTAREAETSFASILAVSDL